MTECISHVTPCDPYVTDDDLYLFNEGRHFSLYNKLGAHPCEKDGQWGTVFSVWAPNAHSVSVIGDFNEWDSTRNYLYPVQSSGIWQGFIPDVGPGQCYKYAIHSNVDGYYVEKADPVGQETECPPRTASVVPNCDPYHWGDSEWMAQRGERQRADGPISIYEVHLGSWKRHHDEDYHSLSYREMIDELVPYVKDLGYTHVEFLPVTEHPFFGSWGYQVTGFFAPTRRYGTPQDFMALVDAFHRNGIGVLLDWVPSHFPSDGHGLSYFDGTHLYEHADPKQGYHPDWNSYIFNYGRNEIRSFLISSAMYWLERFHIDGLRVDGVASMLYLDYSREDGEWVPNMYGGRENLEAIHFVKELNENIYGRYPDVHMIAEESTAWPGVSRPTYLGGLGFGMKWDMGWMHDSLKYFREDPVHRKYHHNALSFRAIYAFHENFVLSLSHDEVAHGKGSLIDKMPGDDWQKFANLRALYTYMYALPGKKLLFMGGEFAQWSEWRHDGELAWDLLQWEPHQKMRHMLKELNQLYAREKALHAQDFDPAGFEWIDTSDWEQSIISFLRKGEDERDTIMAAFNLTPVPRIDYSIGVPFAGKWQEIWNSDWAGYGGSDVCNPKPLRAVADNIQFRPYGITVSLPPLAGVMFKWTGK